MRAQYWAAAAVTAVAVLWGGLGYLATRPADFHDYRTMTVSAAQSAYGAVATARLTAGDRVTDAFARATRADAREGLASAAKEFAGLAPPDARSARLRDELAPLLAEAKAALDGLEGDAGPAALRAADEVGHGLSRFIAAHS